MSTKFEEEEKKVEFIIWRKNIDMNDALQHNGRGIDIFTQPS